MQIIKLEIMINASRETVWKAITDASAYMEWTAVFQQGSRFEGSWNQGDSIRFVAENKDGKVEGMISEIAESNYPTYISIRHLGYIMNGVEDTTSEAIRKWAPSYENYTLEEANPGTIFKLDMEVTAEYYDMFKEMWPNAMAKLKEVSEKLARTTS